MNSFKILSITEEKFYIDASFFHPIHQTSKFLLAKPEYLKEAIVITKAQRYGISENTSTGR